MDYKGSTGNHLPVLKDALAIFIAEKLAFVDALVLALARHRGWHVESFDKRLSKLAARGAS